MKFFSSVVVSFLLVLNTCGSQPATGSKAQLNVLNGRRTSFYKPVQQIFQQVGKNKKAVCTGTFVGQNTFLTAAHCVKSQELKQALKRLPAQAVTPVTLLMEGSIFKSSRIHIHPLYQASINRTYRALQKRLKEAALQPDIATKLEKLAASDRAIALSQIQEIGDVTMQQILDSGIAIDVAHDIAIIEFKNLPQHEIYKIAARPGSIGDIVTIVGYGLTDLQDPSFYKVRYFTLNKIADISVNSIIQTAGAGEDSGFWANMLSVTDEPWGFRGSAAPGDSGGPLLLTETKYITGVTAAIYACANRDALLDNAPGGNKPSAATAVKLCSNPTDIISNFSSLHLPATRQWFDRLQANYPALNIEFSAN